MTDSTPRVRTRIAPSPTGIAHVGTLWQALFNYAFAKQHDGDFLVRIEDTDRSRFVAGAEDIIYEALHWAGIPVSESVWTGGEFGPYRQSDRLTIYKEYAQQLLDAGHAYYCFATPEELKELRESQQKAGLPPKYDGRYRDYPMEKALERIQKGEPYVIRMRVPAGKTTWQDAVKGEVTIEHAQIDDQVLMKSDGYPTYHLAVVVDDHLMNISHVMRGEEWISSTPKHLLLYQMFGWEPPVFCHLPLLRNPDRSKLSKRRNDVSIVSYKERGYLPEALLNFLALLGWSHPENKEIFSLDEFVSVFSLERVQPTGPIFDVEKLNWMNGKYIREHISTDDLISRLEPFLSADYPRDRIAEFLPLVRERLVSLADFEPLTKFFWAPISVTPEDLIDRKKATPELAREQLEATVAALEKIESWNHETLESAIRELQEKNNWHRGQYFMMLRYAITGERATPPLFETMAVVGKDKSLLCFSSAVDMI